LVSIALFVVEAFGAALFLVILQFTLLGLDLALILADASWRDKGSLVSVGRHTFRGEAYIYARQTAVFSTPEHAQSPAAAPCGSRSFFSDFSERRCSFRFFWRARHAL